MLKNRYENDSWGWLVWMHVKLTAALAVLACLVIALALAAGELPKLLVWGGILGGAVTLSALLASYFEERERPAFGLGSGPLRVGFLYATIVASMTFGLLLAGVAILLIALVEGGANLISEGLRWARTGSMPKSAWVAFAALATAAIGCAFYLFRLRQRFIYGFTEALAGIAIGGHRLSVEPGTGLPTETGFYFAVLTAGVYLVVRGMDNMHIAAQSGDKIWLKLRTAVDWVAEAKVRRSMRK